MAAAGLFLPGRRLLYGWHPLTKASLALSALPLAFLPWQREPFWLVVPVLYTLGVSLLLLASGLHAFRVWVWRLLLVLGPVIVSLVLVQGFFFPEGERVVFTVGPFNLTLEGLGFAGLIATRLIFMVAPILVALTTTHPVDLALALTRAGLSVEVTYVLLAAVQLLPDMQARGRAILEAQQSRGMAAGGTMARRLKALIPLVSPLLMSALHDAEMRALALDARGFRSAGVRTSVRELTDSKLQRTFRWALPAASGVTLLLALVALPVMR